METSCDETSAAVLVGQRAISSIVSSQVDLHRKWGGVVPEAAARAHVEAILPVIEEALETSRLSLSQIKAFAVSNRPGLVGALSVGVTAAKALSLASDAPLIGVHHLEGHILSPFVHLTDEPVEDPPFPHLCLIVSGGHTELVLVSEPRKYEILGQTLDDAAGEAFDKAARLLGLGYPGGQAIQKISQGGDPDKYKLPRALPRDPYNFSFSGLKTAVLRLVQTEQDSLSVPDAAASVQEAIASVLTAKAIGAAESLSVRALTLVGGVAANQRLRESLKQESQRAGLAFYTPPVELCTDNAAMIGIAGSMRLAAGERDDHNLDTLANASLP